jgi:rSAM/selenodomain-associated transferase 1
MKSLIIFTRYPEAGKTKTRMTPVLGKEGAALLQQKMTEHTLIQGRKLQENCPISLLIYFTGGTEILMENWLGTDLTYKHQGEGNLGERMQLAFAQSFASGMTQGVIIGTDCPAINQILLAEAFTALDRHDLVLGPALDGGYYLIGLSRFIPQLFVGIAWGTSQVFSQTQGIARQLGLTVYELVPLADVDRPQDLRLLSGKIK